MALLTGQDYTGLEHPGLNVWQLQPAVKLAIQAVAS